MLINYAIPGSGDHTSNFISLMLLTYYGSLVKAIG